MKASLTGTWKHTRWKENLKLLPPLSKIPKTTDSDILCANFSITKLAKDGQLELARNLFDKMPIRTVVSWNSMISGYSKWGKYKEALDLLSKMHLSNVKLNETTFSSLLSVCSHSKSFSEGKQLHCLVLKSGSAKFELVGCSLLYLYSSSFKVSSAERVFVELYEENELLWSLMLVGYVQCNLMSEGLELFMKIPNRNVVVWTTLISGYARSDHERERALELFWWMRKSGEALPNEFTFDCVLRVCGKLGILSEGRLVHGLLIKFGFEFDKLIGGTLIEFYCECEAIDDSQKVCYGMGNSLCLNALNSLLRGLILVGRISDAEEVFERSNERDSRSYNIMIKGYAMSGQVEKSSRLFEKMPNKTIISLNTMISVYSRNCELDKAVKLFEEAKGEGNTVTWNSMMSGYVQSNEHEEAFKLYVMMCRLNVSFSRSTFSALLHACTCLGSLQLGQLLHGQVVKTPFESNVYVGTSLVDMYSKCGSISDAEKSFTSVCHPNVAACTALINAYVHHGLGIKAFSLFENMFVQGIVPNAATILGILSACGRAGLINEGMKIFNAMESFYGVVPSLEHYACVVDLLGRSGHLQEAEEFIKNMPIEADGVIWGALLNACWFWMDMEMGERVAAKMLVVNPIPVSAYIILSNIYAVLGKWMEKIKVRNTLKKLEVKKSRSCSWIELKSGIHVFYVEDRGHPGCNLIYETLEHLTTNINYITQSEFFPYSCNRNWFC